MVLSLLEQCETPLLLREFKPKIEQKYNASNVTKNKIFKALQQCMNENLILFQNNTVNIY